MTEAELNAISLRLEAATSRWPTAADTARFHECAARDVEALLKEVHLRSRHIQGLTAAEIDTFWWFVDLMKLKLSLNAHKGGWQNESIDYLLRRLHEELRELDDGLALPRADHEAADVANMAMMVADVWRRKYGTTEAPVAETLKLPPDPADERVRYGGTLALVPGWFTHGQRVRHNVHGIGYLVKYVCDFGRAWEWVFFKRMPPPVNLITAVIRDVSDVTMGWAEVGSNG